MNYKVHSVLWLYLCQRLFPTFQVD